MKREIISVITTFVLILSSHFSMIYALDKPHLNLNEKEDSVEVTLNLPKVENGLDAFSGKIDYDQNKLELVKVKPVSYTHLTLPTTVQGCRSRWSPYH